MFKMQISAHNCLLKEYSKLVTSNASPFPPHRMCCRFGLNRSHDASNFFLKSLKTQKCNMPLTQWQRDELRKLQKSYIDQFFRYGDVVKTRKGRKYCRRVIRMPKWCKERNKITRFPEYLKPFHVEWMLLHDEELPDPEDEELCHDCVDPNPKHVSRKDGAHCFEGTHFNLHSHRYNRGQAVCHKIINDFQIDNRNNPRIRTTGTIYVSDVTDLDSDVDHECEHDPPCFGNYGWIPLRRSKRLKKKRSG